MFGVCVLPRVRWVFQAKLVHQEKEALLVELDFQENKGTLDLKDNQWALIWLKKIDLFFLYWPLFFSGIIVSLLFVYQGDTGQQGFPGVFGLFGPKVCTSIKLNLKPKWWAQVNQTYSGLVFLSECTSSLQTKFMIRLWDTEMMLKIIYGFNLHTLTYLVIHLWRFNV